MGVLAIAVKKPVVPPVYIPTGLIVPYTAGAAPSGWSSFGSANGYDIIGAGDTYAVGDSGVGTGDITFNIATAGAHFGITSISDIVINTGGKYRKVGEAGDHAHTIISSYTPPYQECYLIKAAGGNEDFPANSVLWTYGDDKSGVATNIWTDGYIFKANSNVGAGGSNSISVATNAAGQHSHGTKDSGDGSGLDVAKAAGSHTHTPAITMSPDLYKRAMAAWRDAGSDINIDTYGSGIIGMYESLTPPSGWYLCNGSNGTPDMRNYFIKNTTQASAGSSSGDGSVTGTTPSTILHGVHNHTDAGESGFGDRSSYHADNYQMAGHAQLNQQENGWLPPYYALAFIMYGG